MLSKVGHLLGYHSIICNCTNLGDAIQQHPLMDGITVEVRSEFITFNVSCQAAKPQEKTKTKIHQIYIASNSAGSAHKILTKMYSSQAKVRYPLSVHARFIPNITDL